MMRKAVLAAPVAALVLAGCVVGPSLAERMSGYVGRSESALVAGMGVPNRKIDVDGTTYFAYVQQDYQYQPGFAPASPYPYGFYGPFYTPYFPPSAYVNQCTITFAIRDKMVKSFTLRGNAC
jgi:hypothetical protein